MAQRDLRMVLIGLGVAIALTVLWIARDVVLEQHRAPPSAPAVDLDSIP